MKLRKVQKILMYLLYTILAVGATVAVGSFIIQYPEGTDVFTVDRSGNVTIQGILSVPTNTSYFTGINGTAIALDVGCGNITATSDLCADLIEEEELNTLAELNTQLTDAVLVDTGTMTNTKWCKYLSASTDIQCTVDPVTDTTIGNETANVILIRDTWIPNNATFDRAYADTQDSAQDECSEITGCIVDAWEALVNMTLNDGLIYIGDGSNNPAAQTVSGDIAITSSGVVTVVNTQGIGYTNISNWVTCGANEHFDSDGTTLSCTADVDTTYDNGTGLALVSTTFSVMPCPDNEILKYDSDHWACEVDVTSAGAGILNNTDAQLSNLNVTGTLNVTGISTFRDDVIIILS